MFLARFWFFLVTLVGKLRDRQPAEKTVTAPVVVVAAPEQPLEEPAESELDLSEYVTAHVPAQLIAPDVPAAEIDEAQVLPFVMQRTPAEVTETSGKKRKPRKTGSLEEPISLQPRADGAFVLHHAADNVPVKKTLSALLENLDSTFETLKLPTMPTSWLSRTDISGLKKLGVHVPNPWFIAWHKDPSTIRVNITKKMPSLMSVSTGHSGRNYEKRTKGEWICPQIMFAVKLRKLPWNVHPHPGVPYLFGYAYGADKKLAWMHMYLTVDGKTGELRLCDELTQKVSVIPMRSPASRRQVGDHLTVQTKAWAAASLLTAEEHRTLQEMKLIAMNSFKAVFDWWTTRDERWSVAVKKDKDRITFGVAREQTKLYFSDREKITTARGNARRILHYVPDYTKANGTVVAGHVRGLREFDWQGYHCVITAPQLTGVTTANFDVSPYDEEELAQQTNKSKTLSATQVAAELVEMEETDMRPRWKAKR